MIAEANALDGDGDLVAGATLTVPEVKTSSNDASTFKPYNPGEITGPTSPGLPYIAPPDKGCGTLGLIIMAVVAIVVTVYTAGAASGAMTAAAQAAGTTAAFASSATVTMAGITTTTAGILSTTGSIVAGAIAGAAGAAASLAAGSLMGVASFNWRGVAAGAITGGITGGIAAQYGSVAEALSGAGGIGKASVLALANGGANYAGQKLAGVDTSFSWRSIAASAVSSVVTAKVAPGLVKKMGIRGDFAADFAYGMTGGMVSLAARTSFGQTLHRSDYTTVVADAFGNALGSAIAHGSQRRQSNLEAKERENWGLTSPEQDQLHSLTDAQQQVFFDAAANGKGVQEALAAAAAAPVGASQRPSGYQLADGTLLTDSQLSDLQYTTDATSLRSGVTAATEPGVIVTPDASKNADFMQLRGYAMTHHLPAPTRSGEASLQSYRNQMWAQTSAAYNGWATQNQAFYASQGYGAGVVREGPALEGRNDLRDLKAMGHFVLGGVKDAINGIAMLSQMAPGQDLVRRVMGTEMWQPFDLNGSAEQAGAIAFGVAGVFVGGGGIAVAARSEKVTSAARMAGRVDVAEDLGSLATVANSTSQSAIRARVEVALVESAAARRGSAFDKSLVAQIERRQTATDFYSARGYSGADLKSHLEGIDFTQPVNPVLLRQGSFVDQFVGRRGVGSYFAPVGTPGETLGIILDGRVRATFQLQQNVRALRSTAADYEWPEGLAPGGGTQYVVGKADRIFFLPINK